MLVSTIAITAVVAAAVFGWRALTGADDGDEPPAAEWDAIALVDRVSGEVVVVDRDGEEQHRIDGAGRVAAVHAHGDRLALVGITSITLTDTDPAATPTVVPIERGSLVVPLETTDTLHLLVGDPAGGNLLIVDVDDGSVLDVAALAAPTVPKLFVDTVRVDATGTVFAVADANNFQTIVVGDEIEGAAFLADQPIAVGSDLIATSQVVNLQADVALVDLERATEAIVATELPRGGVMTDDELTMVSVDGGVFRLGPGDREAEEIGEVAVPAGGRVSWAVPTHGGDRLVVGGPSFAAVVDLDGTTLFTTTFATSVDVEPPRPGWRCLPVGGGDTYHSVVDLGSGEQLADLAGVAVTDVSADGCMLVGDVAGAPRLVDGDRIVELGQVRGARIAPDGTAIVWTTLTGGTQLARIDDAGLADPVDLPAPTNLAVAFLDR